MKLFKVGSFTVKFKVAKLLLEENYDKVNKLLLEWCKTKHDRLKAIEIMTWPMFAEYIKTKSFEDFKLENKAFFETTIVEN